MAIIAILICDIQILMQALAWVVIAVWIAIQWRKLHKHWQLQHHADDANTANSWTLRSNAGDHIEGRLVQQGYRSAALLVLVIEDEKGRRIRLPVWIDSVSSAEYSYLNLQLMFNTHS